VPQFAVLIYADDSAHAPDASASDLDVHDRHAEDLRSSGAMVAAYAFTPRAAAISVRRDATTAGPFVPAEQSVAGFYVLEAPDLDAAVAMAGSNPVVRSGAGGVEVRAVHSGGPVG
jgi:hypothetical protein